MTRIWSWSLRLLVLAAAAALVPACSDSGDDDAPLTVTFLSPTGGQTGVCRLPAIYIRFDRPLKPATVTSSNFGLTNSGGIVSAPVTYHPYLNEVRMVPAAALDASRVYQVTLTVDIEAADGTKYAGGWFQFTTTSNADITPPTFSGAASAVNPAKNSIDLTWSTSEAGAFYDVFMATASGQYDFTAPRVTVTSPAGTTVVGLTANTTYYFVVRARDSSGISELNEVERSATTLP
jgi:hypothetical protein